MGPCSRTTGPILGLFVLIWMHFSYWIQIWQYRFDILKFFEKAKFCELFADDIRVEKAKWAMMWGYIQLGKCLLLGVGLTVVRGYGAEVLP